MRRSLATALFALFALSSLGSAASASFPVGVGADAEIHLSNPEYHVYRNPRGECEVDTRTHDQMQSARGSSTRCLGHFDYRLDAEKARAAKVKAGACSCPSGNNCG